MRIGLDLRWLHQALSHQPEEECPGGIGAYSLYLTKQLMKADAGHNYILFGSRAFPKELLTNHFPERAGCSIVLLPSPPVVRVAQATLGMVFRRLWEKANVSPVLREQELDIMHFHEQGAVLHCQAHKTVLTVHDMMLSVYDRNYFNNGVSRWLWRRHVGEFRRADAILAISDSTRRDVIAYTGVKPSKVKTIRYGLAEAYRLEVENSRILEEKKRHGISGRYFLYVGGLQFNKNIPVLIRAFQQMALSDKGVQLVMAGEHRFWPEQRVRLTEQIAKYELERQVIFTGQLNWSRLKPLYAGAVALVHPALYEGFGFTPLEAMACGCPVIASNTSSLPEVVGEAGLLRDPNQPEEFARAMELMLTDAEFRANIARAGKERATKFYWEKAAEMTLDVYHDLDEWRSNDA